ncbi:MAG: competence/damage-inducible protein A [Deltaproteobacteria bacterium]|nr:competence/damage-inducible protein A [Deltaproteobacteria bacterium]
MTPPTAAAVIIGNEVLTAKVRDENGPLLIRRLRDRGIPLRWMATVPDEVPAIAHAVRHARSVADVVFTSGGIGPTHDDVTVEGVSVALGVPVVRLPEIEEVVRRHREGDVSDVVLRLANAPRGATVLEVDGSWFPALGCDRTYMLPGVPELFKLQLEAVLGLMPGVPVVLECLYVSLGEPEIAEALDQVAAAFPDVALGSYPHFKRGLDYRVKLTAEHVDGARVRALVDQLERTLPPGCIVRRERG